MNNDLIDAWYYKIWKNGKYLDLWSINHTLSGIVIAGPLYYFSISFVYSIVVALVLIVGWEIYEIYHEIYETWQNKCTDIITGIIAFFCIWYLYPYWMFSIQFFIYIASLAIFLILEIWGYIAYKATDGTL